MDDDNPLYRHIKIEKFINNTKILRNAFRPRGTDNGCLSVYDGKKMTVEESFRNQEINFQSLSLAAAKLIVGDCKGVGRNKDVDLDVVESPIEKNPAHVHIDFNKRPLAVSINEIADTLCERANKYGVIFPENRIQS